MTALLFLILLFPSHVFGHYQFRAEWESWKHKHGKSYVTDDEEQYRRGIWMKNFRFVMRHNNRSDQTFKMEMNEFADQLTISYLPKQFDWRTKGAISPVKNQGQMGDAASIVATECIESYNFIKTGKLEELSEEESHDCCAGSRLLPEDVFTCIHNIGGLCSEADYPKQTDYKCHNSSCTPVVKIDGGKKVPQGNENLLLQAVLQVPVMVAIDASHASFQLYRSGIYNEPSCSSTELDHVVEVVGYGTKGQGNDYWIVKNSWGINWGMKGYILMSRNKHNQCGIASYARYPY
ncbi:hypothetical protein KUTeg_023729 [Tegillarca granosa]|uniref:Uncharacterized protein n=1 Tax=Tegillarca granosa TaxID=220873 RepID=A0ABQ9E5T7_TEGGR|nr:hypothetical protein KUTeg_023729 [Tegillarca granosa]